MSDEKILPGRVTPWRQTYWDWRAAGNFICGGSGTGLLFFATLAAGNMDAYRTMALVALAFIGCGLFCVWLEIGKPLRSINVYFHPQTSWMTREAIVAGLLFLCGIVTLWFGAGFFAGTTALLGIVFLYCQGRILLASKGIPAWREPKVMPLILATGFVEGAGLAVVLSAFLPGDGPRWLAGALLGALILRRIAWTLYFKAVEKSGLPKKAMAVLRPFGAKFEMVGQLLPEITLVMGIFYDAVLTGLTFVAGLIAAAAGWWLKYTLVVRAAYNQGYALPVLPVRGQGEVKPGIKPGWTK
ncbi:MAG: dimethyl sulfoxide reductase anchor subunit [Zoogloeaceae bacterium]|jgi:phenylacetyl-CoA:acceptor oxidoreductase subunit 2|nr:dimethyl sulfoxide reductase anchor subunit [Zoogloeaceae bacterium]